MPFPSEIDATTLALFTAFSVSITQLVKQEYPNLKHLFLYLISSGGFIGAALVFVFLPIEWKAFFLLMIGGISVPGGVGLVKEIRREGPAAVEVLKTETVNIKEGGRTSVIS